MAKTGILLALLALLICSAVYAKLPADYTMKSAKEKMHILWKQIDDTEYVSHNMPLPQEGYNMANFSKLFSPQYDAQSYLMMGDELPRTRAKLVHSFGSVAMVQLKITNTEPGFTGVFQSGGMGLLRISPATMDHTAIAVGLGLKIFIDQQRSQNFLLLFTRVGQGSDRNFFAHPMSNIIPSPPVHPLDAVFEQAIKVLPGPSDQNPENGLNVPLYEQASVTTDGTTVDQVVAPYQVTLNPNHDLDWDSADTMDYRDHLGKIPMGTVLYTVMARRGKDDADVEIGQLVSTGVFKASMYGDNTLFFNHARMPWKM